MHESLVLAWFIISIKLNNYYILIIYCVFLLMRYDKDPSHYRMLQEILILLKRILLTIVNGYRGWMEWEIRGKLVERSVGNSEPSEEADEKYVMV